jgi:cytochrome c
VFELKPVGLKPMGIKVKPLKFDNEEIKEHISSFTYLDKEGNIKQKKRSYTPINVPKKSRLKGLKLYQGRDKHNLQTPTFFSKYSL